MATEFDKDGFLETDGGTEFGPDGVVERGQATISAEASDGFVASETLTKTANLQCVATDGLSGSDSGERLAQFFSTLIDGATLSDSGLAMAVLAALAEDGAQLSEIIYHRTPSGALSVTFEAGKATISFVIKKRSITFN